VKKSEKNQIKVSCIIPAHNEAPRIEEVLKVVCEYPGFDEVIVVDDASSDRTSEVAAAYHPTKLIKLSTNRGKAGAVLAGFAASHGAIIVLLDADLVNLTHRNLDALIAPTQTSAALSISLLKSGWLYHRAIGIDPWSGGRAFPRAILSQVQERNIESEGYTLESNINDSAIALGIKIVSVPWENVTSVLKHEKRPGFTGLIEDLKMYGHIYLTFGVGKTLYQQLVLPLQVRRSR
jgi:glycosyltransferase involved in cell wall biosynthesis